MSAPRIEIRHGKKKMQSLSPRDTMSGDILDDLPHSSPMRRKEKRIDPYNISITTLWTVVRRFLKSNVGRPVNDIRSDFIAKIIPRSGAAHEHRLRQAFETMIVSSTDAHRASELTLNHRYTPFLQDAHGILRNPLSSEKTVWKVIQDLYPVPKAKWKNKSIPEAWELRNGVWSRVSFIYPQCVSIFGTEWRTLPYHRTNNNENFKGYDSRPFSRQTCSKKEIKQEILPALKALGLEAVNVKA